MHCDVMPFNPFNVVSKFVSLPYRPPVVASLCRWTRCRQLSLWAAPASDTDLSEGKQKKNMTIHEEKIGKDMCQYMCQYMSQIESIPRNKLLSDGVPWCPCDCLCLCPARVCCDEIICFVVIRLVPVIAQGIQGLQMDRNGSTQSRTLHDPPEISASFATVILFAC